MAYNYPYGNGQQLNLDWFLTEWKNLLAAWEAEKNGIEGALQAEIDRAEAALADVFAARDAAAQSAANALESKNAAAQSASDASGYLATVHADANTASNAAQNAAQSENNAADSAQTALTSKKAAGQSERNAAQSAADALANKDAAAQSASDAEDAAASVEDSAQQIANNTANVDNLMKQIPTDEMQGRGFKITDGAENLDIVSISGTEGAQYAILGEHLPLLENKNNTAVQSDGTVETSNSYRMYKIDVSNIDTLYIGIQRNGGDNRILRCWGYDENDNPIRSLFSYTGSQGAIRSANVSDITYIRLSWANNANFIAFSGEGNVSTVPNVTTTFKGENNIICPTATIDMIYRCDIQEYIAKKLSETQASLLENIGG